MKITQFEKTGSKGNLFIPLGDLKTKIHFRNYLKSTFETISFFVTITLFQFNGGVCLHFNKSIELKKKTKTKPQKNKY